ncbi:MAG: D-alanyl-D-alanine carboxypeptidase [Leptolyngbyaceae cyanobacterium bins.59]|nr:D-alanyl-D-alanine carboxypeptidase [Leptolyngbyaceae cyanobacterium bins.59]
MLEIFTPGIIALWLNLVAGSPAITDRDIATLWDLPTQVLSGQAEPDVQRLVQQYLNNLARKGPKPTVQGIWIQTGQSLLADHQGTVPLSAASLTKVATSLVALDTWGLEHRFETLVSATGPIEKGILKGSLIVQGSGDPLFVWEEAIALGNALNKLGIRQVQGNLLITGPFYMNYEMDLGKSGMLLKQALDSRSWYGEIEYQHQLMPSGTPRPEVSITGKVFVSKTPIPKSILLIRHQSLPLFQLIKLMNVYSNNAMAEILAESVGGAQQVAAKAAAAAAVPPNEIQLINGSGLGEANRISPRAVCALFVAIQQRLHTPLPLAKRFSYTIADLFPVAGRDDGTVLGRRMPLHASVKTGTLDEVSALAGVFPTRDRGLVWFAILNSGGGDWDDFRARQDQLLQQIQASLGRPVELSPAITPQIATNDPLLQLGASLRNQMVGQ